MVTNWSVRLEKHQTIESLLMVNFLRIFKMLHFSIFFEIFEIHQYLLVKLLNALNFIWTLYAKHSRTWLVLFWRLLFYDYCDVAHSIGVQNGFLHFFLFTGTDFWCSGHCFVLKLEVYVCLVKSLLILSFYLSKQLKERPRTQNLGVKPL